MSKQKDKKNKDIAIIQKQFQSQKRDIIDNQFTIKKLEQRLAQKVLQNQQLSKQLEQVHLIDKQKIKILIERTQDDQKRLSNQINRITQLEINATRYESLIKSLNQQLSVEKEGRQKQTTELKIRLENQRAKFKFQLQNLQMYAEHKERTEQQIVNLRQKIQYQKSEKVRELADKQRQKVQATDKLRDEMLKKIREMKTNLLSLKKQQLSTTTRLTILQNHQLTSELQYQSKQTQKLIFKQQSMNNKIKQLTQQLTIHKQVQQQLAKRSHFSKGVIKKLNDRIVQLQKQITNNNINNSVNNNGQQLKNSSNMSEFKNNLLQQSESIKNDKDALKQIQKQLELTQKKYVDAHNKYLSILKQRETLTHQLQKYQNSSNGLAMVLITFLQQNINKKNIINTNKNQIQQTTSINLQEICNKKVDEWTNDERYLIIKILLNNIKPYLSKKAIINESIQKLSILQNIQINKLSINLPKLFNQSDQNLIKGLKDLPVNIASKIVGSNLRDWGNKVRFQQNSTLLRKKFKINDNYRG